MSKENQDQLRFPFNEDFDPEFVSQRGLEILEERVIDNYLTLLEKKGYSQKRIEEIEEILNNSDDIYDYAGKKTNTTSRQLERASDGGYSGRGDTYRFFKCFQDAMEVIEAFEKYKISCPLTC